MKEKQERLIMEWVKVINNINDISKKTKLDKTKVESIIITLARKNKITKDRAKTLLKDSKAIKFLEIPFETKLKKMIEQNNDKYEKITNI